MKVLLAHPEDSPVDARWAEGGWDLVVDLGWAGAARYEEWARRLGCPVRGMHGFGAGPGDFRRVREILRPGLGILVDEEGLDWWEILAPLRIHEMLNLVLVQRAVGEIAKGSWTGTRAHPVAELFGKISGTSVRYLERRNGPGVGSRWRDAARRMSAGQMLQTAFDKWDMDYRLRKLLARRRERVAGAAVLLPSGYVNVTRMLSAYARVLPEQRFLLVTTRESGVMPELAANIDQVSLAGFAGVPDRERVRKEKKALEATFGRWLATAERGCEELGWALASGWFQKIGASLGQWLGIREAWRNVLEREEIQAVLCGDENNPTNRIPVLLARRKNLRTVHCDHGALDVLLALRAPACDTYLVKGEMERDFLTRTSGVDPARVVKGAPPRPELSGVLVAGPREKGTIVFFSEQYELTQGRTHILYDEVLPRLCAVARRHGRRVVIKLHPFESRLLRSKFLETVLPLQERQAVELVQGPLTESLLEDSWFAVTVESSVTVDCAIRGIPCYVCRWFITPVAGYGEQFVRYGAAQELATPDDVARIPEMLAGFRDEQAMQRLWSPITAEKLAGALGKAPVDEALPQRR